MQNFVTENDLIQMRGEGVVGLPVPEGLQHLRNDRLVWSGNDLLDVSTVADWLIDDDGRKRHPAMHDDESWQAISCDFDDVLILDAGVWRVETDADRTAAIDVKRLVNIKVECGRRIALVASDHAQSNMLANYTVGTMTATQKTTFEAGLSWIAAMQANQDALVADDALDYMDDVNWPDAPADIPALVAQY